ncbi:patatin-like phospholipase family protein [Thermaerobacillus caldiproteolyticus]|uniref:NTE family protein n=1 Tax=Thermaerobacillus caldiproteolyticus TaxID=247480 RepID=A0A7V9Z3L9_9BACL|nr:patatin-like phospholipase family protein [Anoxybacillus caldiproteolyticus]MBA2873437.1 NTE family protein [Anoxybacillus caldiproteolyticus]QPA30024.1 patatin-like phospholipase family protein [Anoxybacillus caldiproteolyticus]
MEIDIVFSGGGVKGFALIGAYEAIEAKGFRFKRLAGTSAGSIVAALIAAGYTSRQMIDLIDELELRHFLDERTLVSPFSFMKWLLLYWRMGLYKGQALEQWMEDVLAAQGVKTFADLPSDCLYIVASDVTNGRLLILPDDLPLYGIDPGTFSVAKAVRMSVSIPYFFEPVKLQTGRGKHVVVDGGVLSNFPLFLFDDEEKKMKKRPVLGIQLSAKLNERPKKKIRNAIELYEALFMTMKEAHDARYISRRHEKNIVFLPVRHLLSTEFVITKEERDRLIEYGRTKTEQFLRKWTY